jgi:hypothetical protein
MTVDIRIEVGVEDEEERRSGGKKSVRGKEESRNTKGEEDKEDQEGVSGRAWTASGQFVNKVFRYHNLTTIFGKVIKETTIEHEVTKVRGRPRRQEEEIGVLWAESWVGACLV